MTEIVVTYSSVDRCRKRSKFKTLRGAQAFAQNWIGSHPEIGSRYAVSGDGIGKIGMQIIDARVENTHLHNRTDH